MTTASPLAAGTGCKPTGSPTVRRKTSTPTTMDPSVFERAEHALCDHLRADGLTAEVVHRDSWFRAIIVTGEGEDDQVTVDLGYDYRANPPVRVDGIGPVLDVEDVVTGKVRAFYDRGVERDYSDIDSILTSERWTVADLYDKATGLFPGITREEFADRLNKADTLDPDEYAAIGISPTDLIALQRRLTAAGKTVTDPDDGNTKK